MTAEAPVAVASARSLRPPSATATQEGPRIPWTIVAGVCGLLMLVPWQTESTRMQMGYLDFSWVWALSDAFAHGRVFGRDLVFTAGPLGFLGPRAYIPATGSLLWIGWSAIAVIWSSLLWRQLARSVANPVLRVVLFIWMVLCATLSSDAFFLAIPILAGAIAIARADDDGAPPTLDLVAISALLATAALVKFSYLVAGTATIGLLSVWDVTRRKWPIAGITYLLGMLLFWIACRQPLGALPDFFRTSLQIAGGYTSAMSLTSGDRRSLYGVILTMVVGLTVAAWIAVKRRSVGFGIVTIIWLGIWLLVAKASLVRFDPGHDIIAPLWATSTLPVVWAAMLMLDAGLATSAIMILLILASAGSSELALRNWGRPGLASSAIGAPRRALRALAAIANPRRALGRERATFDAMRRGEVARTPLPQLIGSVDAYPSDVSALLSHGFTYQPRPVLQSYAAYTPPLAELNAAFLRGGTAPENLLFDIATIDTRLASMEDGSSWMEIWRRYSLAADTGGFLWLRRRATPIAVADPQALPGITATIGAPFRLPDVACGGVMASIDLRPTLYYRVRTLLWKAPELVVRFSPGDREYRVEHMLLGVPFLLSPTIESREHFAEFMQTGATTAKNSRPVSAALRVLSPHPERYFASVFSVRFFSVQPSDSCSGSR
jgi:hypothetical protein